MNAFPALLALALSVTTAVAIEKPASAPPPTPLSDEVAADNLTEIVVRAAEPRYVAPTRRDRIGRIWAPVYINGKGPFRLVLDSGATHSGITAHVAQSLALPLDQAHQVMLRGVTGSAAVPTVRIDSFTVGELEFHTSSLPIVTDALGGADGILGADGMTDRRILVDFQHDLIAITRSHGERAPDGFLTIPFRLTRSSLVTVDGSVGNVRIKAIIDTGGQVTIANLALRNALEHQRTQLKTSPRLIEGVTADLQSGDAAYTPPLLIGADALRGQGIAIQYTDVTYADMRLFEHWHLIDEPVMLVGMDALGLLDTIIFDYRRHELQIRMRSRANDS